MKLENLYVFYANENVADEIRRFLEVKPYEELGDGSGRYELISNEEKGGTLEGQLKKTKWSDVGIGRHTLLFYLQVDDEEKCTSVEKIHIIIRHKTEDEIRQDTQESLKNLLTMTDSSVTV